MFDENAYLLRSLDQRVTDGAEAADLAFNAVMRQNAGVGRLASGNTLLSFQRDSERVFNEEFGKAAQFAYNLTEERGADAIDPLRVFASSLIALVMEKVIACGKRTGVFEPTLSEFMQKIRVTLEGRRERLLDDFSHGMAGNVRMKKEASINVINNQTNSPGAIQQAGVGNFSQTAFTQQHHALVSAQIDMALASEEFSCLKQDEKDELSDIAEALKAEAAKDAPDLVG